VHDRDTLIGFFAKKDTKICIKYGTGDTNNQTQNYNITSTKEYTYINCNDSNEVIQSNKLILPSAHTRSIAADSLRPKWW